MSRKLLFSASLLIGAAIVLFMGTGPVLARGGGGGGHGGGGFGGGGFHGGELWWRLPRRRLRRLWRR